MLPISHIFYKDQIRYLQSLASPLEHEEDAVGAAANEKSEVLSNLQCQALKFEANIGEQCWGLPSVILACTCPAVTNEWQKSGILSCQPAGLAQERSSIVLEKGELAPFADGSAIARSGSTSVLTAVVCEPPPQPLWKARVYDNFLEVCSQRHDLMKERLEFPAATM